MAWGHGDHRLGGCATSDAGNRWHAAYRAESPGPVKDNKLVPRLAETAKSLWLLYLSLTVVCMLAYWAAGMSMFDAISHSFSTVAIGGFSTHDASIAYFDNPLIEFMRFFHGCRRH